MDTINTLVSTALSAGLYILYKIAQRYYFRSGCHDRTFEITIIDKEDESKKEDKSKKEDESKKGVIEMV